MFNFDVMLGMDWLHACFASIDCRSRVVRFNFPNEPVNGGNYFPRGCLISYLKACRMISKGCLYHIVRVQDLDIKISPIELVHVVKEFLEVFPNDLPSIHPIQIQFQFLLMDGSCRIERVEVSTQRFTRKRFH